MKLWQKVTIGLIAGIAIGSIAQGNPVYMDLVATFVKPIGDIFMKMLLMIVAPLVYFSLVQGITSMNDPSSLGRIGLKACVAFLVTTFFAIIIGMVTATLMEPGVGTDLTFDNVDAANIKKASFNVIAMIIDIVPGNILISFAENRMLQIVFFAIFTGIAINKIHHEESKLIEFFHMISKLVFKMMGMVINLSPYGAFSLTCWLVTTQGTDVLKPLTKLIFAVSVGMAIQYCVFGVLIRVFAKLNPWQFYRKSLEYQAVALSTSSTKAALLTTMKVCRERLGISNDSTSFILPLGTSVNMDGMAIYLSMCAIFFAQVLGVQLSGQDYLVIALTSTLGSIGGAGIPGGSMVMLPMILSSVNLPIEGVALIAGIDRILDMLRTTINITGDVTVTMIIDKTEGLLDEKMYLDNE